MLKVCLAVSPSPSPPCSAVTCGSCKTGNNYCATREQRPRPVLQRSFPILRQRQRVPQRRFSSAARRKVSAPASELMITAASG